MNKIYKILEEINLHKNKLDELRNSLIDSQIEIWGEFWSIKKLKTKLSTSTTELTL